MPCLPLLGYNCSTDRQCTGSAHASTRLGQALYDVSCSDSNDTPKDLKTLHQCQAQTAAVKAAAAACLHPQHQTLLLVDSDLHTHAAGAAALACLLTSTYHIWNGIKN